MIIKGRMFWSFIKFSQLILNSWKSVKKICMWILDHKIVNGLWNSGGTVVNISNFAETTASQS